MADPVSTVLVVEDDAVIAGVLVDYLRQAGYDTHHLARGDAVEPWLAEHPADLLLLDLMLPGKSGLEVCRDLTARPPGGRPRPAIVMVTARVEEIDRLLGLELGADDYICKPFSPREVVARVKAVLRRPVAAAAASSLPASPGVPGMPPPTGLAIDLPGGRAWLDAQDLALTAVELKLLATLVAQPGRIFSRDQLMDAMYRDERVVADRTVDSHVKKLRRKLDEARPGAELVASVYGLGYKLELPAGEAGPWLIRVAD
jgi:two-component system response regulator BaeR